MALRPFNSIAGVSVGNTATEVILANADVIAVNFTASGISDLGPVGNVKITGGTNGQVLSTDGTGNLSFIDSSGGNTAAPMPYIIPVGESYYVPENFQGLFTVPIQIDGTFEVDGILAEVGTAINSISGQIIFDDNGELTGNTGFSFDQTSGNLSVPGSGIYTGNILPSANIIYDLGSPTKRWKDLYLANNTIYIGNSTISGAGGNLALTNAGGGEFVVAGNATVSTLENGNSNISINANANITVSVNGTSNVVVVSSNVVDINGNVEANGIKTDNYYYANGQPLDMGGNPGGSNTYVQFNNQGEFGGTSNLTFDSATNNLALTGNLSTTNLSVTGNGVITGNLSVNGNLIYINVEELSVKDPIITLNTGANGTPPVANTGKDVGTALYYFDTQARTAFMGWDTSNAEFAFGSRTSISNEVVTFNTLGNVRAQTFKGNIDGANTISANYLISNSGCVTISGATIAVNGNNAGIFASLVDDINFGLASNIVMSGSTSNVTIQGNLIANNNVSVSGNVSANLVTGTLTTNAQPNITSIGTLSNLSVTGNINTGNITVTNTVDAVNIKVTDLFSKRTSINIGTNTPIDTFPTSSFRSAKYTMRAGDGTDYQALEVLLVHNNINSIITVYGSLSTSGTDLVVFSTDISAGNVNVYATAVGPNTNLNLLGTYVPD